MTSLSSLPNASCARLATSSGSFLRRRFSSAWRSTSWLSAAKPTQNGASGRAATVARMSTVGFSAIVSGAPVFLSFVVAGAAGV